MKNRCVGSSPGRIVAPVDQCRPSLLVFSLIGVGILFSLYDNRRREWLWEVSCSRRPEYETAFKLEQRELTGVSRLSVFRTTIIESLKFAVCGAFPPGNKV